MRLLLIGAAGSGKGTQAVRLAERCNIAHISSGDLLRRHVRDGSALGRMVKKYVDAGDLVPDAVVMDMLYKPVVAAASRRGYVLDGFPRTVGQAEAAYDVVSELGAQVQVAIHLDVPDDEPFAARSRAPAAPRTPPMSFLTVGRLPRTDRASAGLLQSPGPAGHHGRISLCRRGGSLDRARTELGTPSRRSSPAPRVTKF